jgi:single-stranded DNA-binding protein
MTTRIPVTIEGNLTGDPEHGASDSGNEYARFTIAVNDRRLNETTIDGKTSARCSTASSCSTSSRGTSRTRCARATA